MNARRNKPKAGDVWEVRRPGKRTLTKEIDDIRKVWSMAKTKGGPYVRKRIMFVYWKRLPKGRYTGMSLNYLLARGRRISTKAQRDRADRARWKRLDML